MVLKVLVLLFSKHSLRQRSAQVRKFGVEIIFLNNPLMKKKTYLLNTGLLPAFER